MAIQLSVRLFWMQLLESLAPVALKLQLFFIKSCSVELQVVLNVEAVLSRAQAQNCLQNTASEALQTLFAQLITGLLGLLHPPLKKMSGKKNRLTPSPKKITISTIMIIWKAQTSLGFCLHIPQMPSAAVPMTERLSPKVIPRTVYQTLVFPKKMLLWKKRQIVIAKSTRPRARTKMAPSVVKHLTKNIDSFIIQSSNLIQFHQIRAEQKDTKNRVKVTAEYQRLGLDYWLLRIT